MEDGITEGCDKTGSGGADDDPGLGGRAADGDCAPGEADCG